MGLFSKKVAPTRPAKPVVITPPKLGEWMNDLKAKDNKAKIYKNFVDDEKSNTTYMYDETPILRKNLRAIEKYRKKDCYLLKPEDIRDIILDQNLELGLLKDITFPITKKAKSEYSDIQFDARDFTAEKRPTLMKFLYDMKFYTQYYNTEHGYNTMKYSDTNATHRKDFFEKTGVMIPCYKNRDLYIGEYTKGDTHTDYIFVIGRNLQFRAEDIDSEKLIEAVLISYNPYMKRFVVYSRTYWEIDNRPPEVTKMSYDEYKKSTKTIPELSRGILLAE